MRYLTIALLILLPASLGAGNWPYEALSTGGTVTVYEPQAEFYNGKILEARAAVSFVFNDSDEPIFGMAWISCLVSADKQNSRVSIKELRVRRIQFPEESDLDTAEIASAIEEVIPKFRPDLLMDRIENNIKTVAIERENAGGLNLDPPRIIFLTKPAVLVQIDGDPIYEKVGNGMLKRIVNTPYFIVQSVSSGRFYLRGGEIWFRAGRITGPWRKTSAVPNQVVSLYEDMKSDDDFYEDSSVTDIVLQSGKIPEIVVSTEPAELVATDGKMKFAPIEGTGLLYVTNTPARLFMRIKDQHYYILISGRWYVAKKIKGPWQYVNSENLPDDFRKIPPGSECDDVLASIAGTIPSTEAFYDAQVPNMAEVDIDETTDNVEYDGEPQFEPIGRSGMYYAVNTPTAVIRIGRRYYNCDRGVWFESTSPFGPWAVCIYVPDIIYTIPPNYPVYNVCYVRVYYRTSRFVYFGYTAGYTGCYIYKRTVVYGTGYRYHPWFKKRYFARPWTWGFNVHYDPWRGWIFGAGWGTSRGWFAHRSTNIYAGWWGPEKYHPVFYTAPRAVYGKGYRPVFKQEGPRGTVSARTVKTRRTSGVVRTPNIYDRRSTGVRRPTVGETKRPPRDNTGPGTREPRRPGTIPATGPVTPPTPAPVTRPAPNPGVPSRPYQPDVRPVERPTPPPETVPVTRPAPKQEAPVQPRQPEVRPVEKPAPPPAVQPQHEAPKRQEPKEEKRSDKTDKDE
jgi:hypothetical protein